jgi:hypothetical protein
MAYVYILKYNHQIVGPYKRLKAAHSQMLKQLTAAETAAIRSYAQATRDVKKNGRFICAPSNMRLFEIEQWELL